MHSPRSRPPARAEPQEQTLDEFLAALFGDEATTNEPDVIYAYTRDMAIADGQQIDVTETAGTTGLYLPTTITNSIWASLAGPFDRSTNTDGTDPLLEALPGALMNAFVAGFLHVVCEHIQYAADADPTTNRAYFPAMLPSMPRYDGEQRHTLTEWEQTDCIAAIGSPTPWDPTPCLTIMLPEDD